MFSALAPIPLQTRPDVALVPQVGGILRAYGRKAKDREWDKPARLQDLWLARPPRAAPLGRGFDFGDVAYSKRTGITVDWVLRPDVDSDGRARKAYEALVEALGDETTRIEIAHRALAVIGDSKKARLGFRKPFPLANLRAFHAQNVVQRSVTIDMKNIPIDPEEAAFGHFSFYAVPVGQIEREKDGGLHIRVERFLVYALDSFDFSKPNEPLGFFKSPDVVSAKLGAGTLLTNLSYRDYRASSGKGGDFLVMSDVKSVPKRFDFVVRP